MYLRAVFDSVGAGRDGRGGRLSSFSRRLSCELGGS